MVDYTHSARTEAFHLFVEDFNRLRHLFPKGVHGALTIVKAEEIQAKLDETKYVLAVIQEALEHLPESIEGAGLSKLSTDDESVFAPYKFSGHHREFLRRMSNLPAHCDTSYLASFAIGK